MREFSRSHVLSAQRDTDDAYGPELEYLEAKWAAKESFSAVAALLHDVLPVDQGLGHEAVRQHVLATAIVNYGERYRRGERISTGFVNSAVNQVIAKRFVKKQQMRWTPRGPHLLLQVRVHVLNDALCAAFRKWYPGFGAGEQEELAAQHTPNFWMPSNYCPNGLAVLHSTARNKLKRAQQRPSIIAACWMQESFWCCHSLMEAMAQDLVNHELATLRFQSTFTERGSKRPDNQGSGEQRNRERT